MTDKTMLKYLDDISWETEVWIAETPSHMIHFNGERFLGPYEDQAAVLRDPVSDFQRPHREGRVTFSQEEKAYCPVDVLMSVSQNDLIQ